MQNSRRSAQEARDYGITFPKVRKRLVITHFSLISTRLYPKTEEDISNSEEETPCYGAKAGESDVVGLEGLNVWLAGAPGVLQGLQLSQQWVHGEGTTCTFSLKLSVSPEKFIELCRLVALFTEQETKMITKPKASADIQSRAKKRKR